MSHFALSVRLSAVVLSLCAATNAQNRHVFDIDSSQSTINFSGTITILGINGTLVGQPPTFTPQGAADVDITRSGGAITAAEFVNGGSTVLVPSVNAIVPGPFGPLVSASATNVEAAFRSVDPNTLAPVSFPIAPGGAFATDVVTDILAGDVVINSIAGNFSIPLAGSVGGPEAISGTLIPTSDGLQLRVPIQATFPFSSSSTGILITGTGTVSGTLVANDRALSTDTETISVTNGGTQNFTLSAGTARAAGLFLMLGSTSGTQPGLNLNGVNVPLNPDAWFFYTATYPNAPPFSGAVGALDGNGLAVASMTVPASIFPELLGLTFHHAYIVLGGAGVAFASNPVPLTFTP